MLMERCDCQIPNGGFEDTRVPIHICFRHELRHRWNSNPVIKMVPHRCFCELCIAF